MIIVVNVLTIVGVLESVVKRSRVFGCIKCFVLDRTPKIASLVSVQQQGPDDPTSGGFSCDKIAGVNLTSRKCPVLR